jgi:hypothetical protein
LLTAAPTLAQGTFPAGPADDNTTSLGKFILIVTNQSFHNALMASGYPGYNPPQRRLTSNVLGDRNTVIGRSDVITDGSTQDIGGVPTGSSGTIVSDLSHPLFPPPGTCFTEGPPGSREVHTEIVSLNLTDGGGQAVRAGPVWAPAVPGSFGEVESKDPIGDPTNDFPAESFFDVYVEVDLPPFGAVPASILFNPVWAPMLVCDDNLDSLPPRVVYVHGHTPAVPAFFKTAGPGWVGRVRAHHP